MKMRIREAGSSCAALPERISDFPASFPSATNPRGGMKVSALDQAAEPSDKAETSAHS